MEDGEEEKGDKESAEESERKVPWSTWTAAGLAMLAMAAAVYVHVNRAEVRNYFDEALDSSAESASGNSGE